MTHPATLDVRGERSVTSGNDDATQAVYYYWNHQRRPRARRRTAPIPGPGAGPGIVKAARYVGLTVT